MIKSMTGFASLTHEDERATVAVTLRSVNHRFFDAQLRIPSAFGDLEAPVRSVLQRGIARGRVELSVSVQLRQPAAPAVELNEALVESLVAALDRARARGLVSGPLTPGDLLRLPQVLAIREQTGATDPAIEAHVATSVEAAVVQALAELDAMRVREGEHLAADFERRRTLLADLIERLRVATDQGRLSLEERLRERLGDLRLEVPVDQAALAQEIVRVAARSDIAEEVTRFRAHLAHWAALSMGDEPCGRKLDFLLQEMNREINTIGSKADGVHVSELVIAAKAELERMREQVQNVE
ncbi:MAG: YicC family protein [Acidobacteria bacterium]|nr:YicC family protein [Acidobacteriota bacterium]